MFECPTCKHDSLIITDQLFYKEKNNLVKCVEGYECTHCGHVETTKEVFDPRDEGQTMEDFFPNEGDEK